MLSSDSLLCEIRVYQSPAVRRIFVLTSEHHVSIYCLVYVHYKKKTHCGLNEKNTEQKGTFWH